MNFSIPLGQLSDALGIVGKATATKGLRPILASVLINADNGEVGLAGTDQEIMALARLSAKIEAPGHFTISAKLLEDIISNLPVNDRETEVKCELENGQENLIRISCGRNVFSIPVQGVEDFPPIPDLEKEAYPYITLPADELRRAFKQVNIAVATDENTPALRSICLDFSNDGEIVFVATDSRRLAVTRIFNAPVPPEFPKMALLPAAALAEILKLLETAEDIKLGLFQKQLAFTSDRFQVIARLLDAKFPDYQRVIPQNSSRSMTADRKELVRSLKSVMPIARYINNMVHFDIAQNETKIWSESHEEGRSEVFLPTTLQGDPINIAFNAQYLLDFLNVVDGDMIVLEMTSPNYPGVMRLESNDEPFRYVVMPMNI